MTNKNYTLMSNPELLDEVQSIDKKPVALQAYIQKSIPELWQEIHTRTEFLDKQLNGNISILTRIYCLNHNIIEVPTCKNPNCPTHAIVGWDKYHHKFREFCSAKCSANSESTRNKAKQTCQERFGADNAFQSDDIKLKIKQKMVKLYGVEHALQSPTLFNKAKLSWINTLGVDNPLKSEVIKQKSVEKCQELWGVDNYAQTTEFHKRCHKRYTNPKYPELSFATTWEFKVYDFLTMNHIQFEYQPEISIPYKCEGTHHTYHPDFLVNGRIVEVKGDNFFRINEETGKEEMYLTWKGNLSDEEYEWKCKVMEAKHQCMIANNVIILRHSQIKNLTIEMFA